MMNNRGSMGKELLEIMVSVGLLVALVACLIYALHLFESREDVVNTCFSLVECSDGTIIIDDGTLKQELTDYEIGDADCVSYTLYETGKITGVSVILCPKTIEKLKDTDIETVRSNSWMRGVDLTPDNI